MYSSILGSGEEAADHAHEILAQLSCHGHLAMLAAGVRPDPHPTDVRLCIRRDGASLVDAGELPLLPEHYAVVPTEVLQLLTLVREGNTPSDMRQQARRTMREWHHRNEPLPTSSLEWHLSPTTANFAAFYKNYNMEHTLLAATLNMDQCGG